VQKPTIKRLAPIHKSAMEQYRITPEKTKRHALGLIESAKASIVGWEDEIGLYQKKIEVAYKQEPRDEGRITFLEMNERGANKELEFWKSILQKATWELEDAEQELKKGRS